MNTCNILIIGAGIVGLTLARELVHRGISDILILEKEPELGRHASGRNSGVLHAGIYYAPGSLRAKLCLEGCRRMKSYCQKNNLPLHQSGKVIVAKDESELSSLKNLFERAQQNGAHVDWIDEKQLEFYEPQAKTYQQAIYAHDTAVVDPQSILKALHQELIASQKVRIEFNTAFEKALANRQIQTSRGNFSYQYLINAAGSFADKIAHAFGLAPHLRMIPFKGIYHKLRPEYRGLINGNIYPVPNLQNPFLGVHFTKNIHGEVYLGPTAIPAFGRENYGLIEGISWEGFPLLWQEAVLFVKNSKFRNLALSEPLKYLPNHFFKDCQKLVKHLEPGWLMPTKKIGIRPQLVDWNTKELLMDFLFEKGEDSFHILNAISPAFTSSLAFAEFVADALDVQNRAKLNEGV